MFVKNFSMRFGIFILFLLFAVSCDNNSEKIKFTINGDWAFIDGHGFYNETHFSDSTFFSFHQTGSFSPIFNYHIKNDTFFANIDYEKVGNLPVATIEHLPDSRIVLMTEFVKDTLERINDKAILSNLIVDKDTNTFFQNFQLRHEKFLVLKGITTQEEINSFRSTGEAPDDIVSE